MLAHFHRVNPRDAIYLTWSTDISRYYHAHEIFNEEQ